MGYQIPTLTSNFYFLETDFSVLANIGEAAEYYLQQESTITLAELRTFGEKLAERIVI